MQIVVFDISQHRLVFIVYIQSLRKDVTFRRHSGQKKFHLSPLRTYIYSNQKVVRMDHLP